MVQKMLIILLGGLLLILNGCVAPMVKYNKETKILQLKLNNNKIKTIQFYRPKYRDNSNGRCIQDNFVLIEKNIPKYGNIFIQHIMLDGACSWNILPKSIIMDNIKKFYRARHIKQIENIKIGQYQFSSYILDDFRKIYVVEIWGITEEDFIISLNSALYDEILNEMRK